MAIKVVTNKDASKSATITLTGVAGESDQVAVNVSDLKKFETGGRVSIRNITWSVQGVGEVDLAWDAGTDDIILNMMGSGKSMSWERGGNFKNTEVTGATGDIFLNSGAGAAFYTVVLDVVKETGFNAPVSVFEKAPADATYLVTETVDFQVTFDEDIIVTGAPYVTYTMDACDIANRLTGTTCKAPYVSGNNTRTLTFRRTILAGDDEDGSTAFFAVGALIVLDGGTLTGKDTGAAVDLTITGLTDDGGIIISTP